MKPYQFILITLSAIAAMSLLAQTLPGRTPFSSDVPAGSPAAWNRLPNAPAGDNFSFKVLSDRTGGAYPGGLDRAVALVNADLRDHGQSPAFVLSVGDNIEGMSLDKASVTADWEDFDRSVNRLRVPFIRVPGNHDIGNEAMREVYARRFGRPYFHFLYDNVLFLGLDTEDPPNFSVGTPESVADRHATTMKFITEAQTHPDDLLRMPSPQGPVSMCDSDSGGRMRNAPVEMMRANLGEEQVAYFQKVIADHPTVRWTFLYMHRPGWRPDSPGFAKVIQALAGRNYTVLAGHYHEYQHDVIGGHDYYALGPTAAIPRCSGPNGANQILNVEFVNNVPKVSVEFVTKSSAKAK